MDALELEHSHSPDAIRARVVEQPPNRYLKDFVYGAIDGTVTTFAVVCSVAGVGLDSGIVIVLGVANLIADGFSMAASNYLGTRTDQQLLEKARRMEDRHIRLNPDGEREEVRQIFMEKGFAGNDLDRAVEIITADRERWIQTMLVDELGLNTDLPSPIKSALTTFFAFCIVGCLPLIAYLFGLFQPADSKFIFAVSIVVTAAAFFLIGTAKSFFVDQSWFRSGLETLLVGGCAAILAYLIGIGLKGLAPL